MASLRAHQEHARPNGVVKLTKAEFSVSIPKGARKGYPHCMRIDIRRE